MFTGQCRVPSRAPKDRALSRSVLVFGVFTESIMDEWPCPFRPVLLKGLSLAFDMKAEALGPGVVAGEVAQCCGPAGWGGGDGGGV